MKAISIEHTTEIDARLIIWEIDEEIGSACILDLVEFCIHRSDAAAFYLQEGYPDIHAVKVDEDQEGCQAVGNHWVCIPDALGVFELAEILAQ